MRTAIPRTVEIWPLMGIHSQDTKHGGAWRLHVLASALDHNEGCNHSAGICNGGSGRIERRRLEAVATALKVKRSTFFTWLADARKAGIFSGEGEYLYLASQEKLFSILGCNSLDRSKALVSTRLLFKAGWKDVVFAAYLKVNHHRQDGFTNKMQPVYKGKVISGKTLEDLTGISPRQQRRLNKHVSSRRNIVVTTIPGDWETAERLNQSAREHGEHRHYFPYNDPEQKDPAGIKAYRRVIAHTGPARRTVSDRTASIGAHGRRAAILAANPNGLQLVTVCNYSDSNYRVRPLQAGRQTEARRTDRRWYDGALQSMQFRDWTPEEAREVYILRATRRPRRGGVGVFDRELR